jgi:hypothetical protein
VVVKKFSKKTLFKGGISMKLKTKLLYLGAFFVLALPLIFTGTASAKYQSDGSVPNGTGGWVTPNDMMCIVGVHADGTLDVADGVTSARDCIYLQTGTMNNGTPFDLTGLTTSAACTDGTAAGTNGGDGAKHSWATSFCTKSLTGLDRTQQMCQGIGGTWITTGMCVAYGRDFKGQDASGTPLAIGAKGTVQAAGTGFCYNSTIDSGIPVLSCPSTSTDSSTAFGYSVLGSVCAYSYGIVGVPTSALTRTDGTTWGAGGVDLSTFTTQGDCIANGGSWTNWTPAGTTATAPGGTATIMTFDLSRQAANGDDGCLHCHSTKTEYNGPAERFKDSYLKTGHKNMLRKVTAGQSWAGPDGVVYTTDGTNSIDFGTGNITLTGYCDLAGQFSATACATAGGTWTATPTATTLYYVFGDWMAALPSVVYKDASPAAPAGATNGYSCSSCHTTGASDNTNPGVQSIGTPGLVGVQPQESFPGIIVNAANPKWDIDGITCARCHNATVPSVTQTQIDASAFPSTAPTSGGMGALADGVGRFNLCFGCHGGGSMAKAWPAGTTQYDPTLIATGVSHGAAAGRDFNGHILGNSFLNSPHARYAGVNSNTANGGTRLNPLGKYDLYDPNGSSEYNSIFKGYTCWQSSTSSSPAKTKADGTEIKTQTECEALYGVGAWRDDTAVPADGQDNIQGTCTTCHDVHNSLFVTGQEGIRKECADCHENNSVTGATDSRAPQVDLSIIKHPTTAGTPFDSALYDDSCEVCHMATQALANGDQNSLAVHVWRINTDANYDTFPTADQFNGTNGATKDRNAQTAPETYTKDDGTTGVYPNAVWVDLDLACGQCHGGSLGSSKTHNGAPYMDKAYLSVVANNMHQVSASSAPVAAITSITPVLYNVSLVDGSTLGSAITVNWGDGHSSNGNGGDTLTHTYATAGTFNVLLTASAGGVYDSTSTSVSVPQKFDITINLVQADLVTPDPLPTGATFVLRKNGATIRAGKDVVTETFTNLKPGTYKLKVHKRGYTFDCNSSGNPLIITVGSSNQTVLCTHTP